MMHFPIRSVLLFRFSLISVCHGISLPLYLNTDQSLYYTSVQVDGQPLNLIVDIGSLTTWLIRSDTDCRLGAFGRDKTDCSKGYGTPYDPGPACPLPLDRSGYETALYGGLLRVDGAPCYASFMLNETLVDAQYFMSATIAEVGGFKPTAGLLGLGYGIPDPGQVENTTQGNLASVRRSATIASSPTHQQGRRDIFPATVPKAPILDHIFNNLTQYAPYFSFSLARYCPTPRHGPSSFLHIGGSLPLSEPYVNASIDNSIYLPLQKTHEGLSEAYYNAYIISVNQILIHPPQTPITNHSTPPIPFAFNDASPIYALNTGSVLNYLPSIYVTYINSLYSPPAHYTAGYWFVDCCATVPRFGINVRTSTNDTPSASQDFYMNPLDMIWHDPSTGECYSAFQSAYNFGWEDPSATANRYDVTGTLGLPFLRNVYVEIYRGETRGQAADSVFLAGREYYEV